MPIRVVQLGTPRARHEGLRLGTVRRPPRGVPKAEHAERDYYDVWMPNLAPSAALIDDFKSGSGSARDWRRFAAAHATRRSYCAQIPVLVGL